MNQLDTSPIVTGVGMPVKKGTLDFLQWRDRQIISDLLYQLYPTGNLENNVTATRGCVVTTTGPSTFNLSAGAIYVGTSYLAPVAPQTTGELFILPADQSTTISGDEAILICTVPTAVTPVTPNNGISYYTGDGQDADIVTFTDGSQHNVHDIRTLVLTHGDSSTPGFICLLSDLKDAILPALTSNLFKEFTAVAGDGIELSGTEVTIISLTPTVNSGTMTVLFTGEFLLQGGSNDQVSIYLRVNGGTPLIGRYLQSGDTADDIRMPASIAFVVDDYTAGQAIQINAFTTAGTAAAYNLTLLVECFDAH